MYTRIFFLRFIGAEPRGFDLKSSFHIMFKKYKDKKKEKKMEMLGKNSQNFEWARNEISVYEQKPIKIDDFNKAKGK